MVFCLFVYSLFRLLFSCVDILSSLHDQYGVAKVSKYLILLKWNLNTP